METFTFGKYKGQSIESVIKSNPNYVLWANDNVSFFTLSDEQMKECRKQIRDSNQSYFDRMERLERMWADDYDDEDGSSLSFELDMSGCFEDW